MNVRSLRLVTPVAFRTSLWARFALATLAVLLIALLATTSLAIGSANAQVQTQTSTTLSDLAVSAGPGQTATDRDDTSSPVNCDSGSCQEACLSVGELCTPGLLSPASTWSLHKATLLRAIPSAMPRVIRVVAQHLVDAEPPSLTTLSISRT